MRFVVGEKLSGEETVETKYDHVWFAAHPLVMRHELPAHANKNGF